MATPFRMRCDLVKYRQGFIEVISQIHPGLVNIEAWEVKADLDITGLGMPSDELSDNDIIANTELELTPAQAR